jgi:hypothetical protein
LWRGQVELLRRGVYDHVIPDDLISSHKDDNYCDTVGTLGSLFISHLVNQAIPSNRSHADYYLTSGEIACGSIDSIDGPLGHADTAPGSPDDSAEIPSGRRLDGDCR